MRSHRLWKAAEQGAVTLFEKESVTEGMRRMYLRKEGGFLAFVAAHGLGMA